MKGKTSNNMSASSDHRGETAPLISGGSPASPQTPMQKLKSKFQKLKNDLRWQKTMKLVLIAILLVVLIFQLLAPNTHFWPHLRKKKRNVIFFVTDGMGPASLSMTRSWRQFHFNLTSDDTLTLDKHFIGSSRTRSSSSLVTDSAAGATAFSCALKSYNGAIGVDPWQNPCGTVLESAKLHGFLTGLVVTTRITDATPAAFSSHVDYRSMEDQIAEQQLGFYPLGRMVDLMIGGGRAHYNSRADGRNLLEEAESELGWNVITNRSEFDHLEASNNRTLPLLALLADYDIPYQLDRDPKVYPSLKEEALLAIDHLHKNSEKGFFLMVEGSRIDHAGHSNDPSAQVREVLAFDEMFAAVVQWAKEHPDEETILFSTSDHETGGLTVSRQITKGYPDYVWYPEILDKCKHSGEYMIKELYKRFNYYNTMHSENIDASGKNTKFTNFVQETVFEDWMGLSRDDYLPSDIADVFEYCENNNMGQLQDKLNDMISVRAQIGWSTHGHSAVDVNTYMYANNKELYSWALDKLQGNRENTEFGRVVEEFLGLDIDEVTELVKKTNHGILTEYGAETIQKGHDEYGHVY